MGVITAIDKLNIAIIDDHASVREGIRHFIDPWPHGTVVLEAANGLEYEHACADAPPVHLAIVDLSMPVRDGFQTMAWMREHQPEALALAITFDPRPDVVHQAVSLGARGILSKEVLNRDTLAPALDDLRTTGFHMNELMQQQLTHRPDPGSPLALRKKVVDTLTPRELEFLLHYIGPDLPSIAEVARRMGIEPSTAEGYR